MSDRLIPFGWLPGHWGLKGLSRELAKAEYEIKDEYKLAMKIAEIMNKDNPQKLEQRKLEINFRYKFITEREYIDKLAKLNHTGKDLEVALLEIQLEYNEITQIEFEKQKATINEEPWVTIINLDYDQGVPNQGSIELDWNEYFVQDLEKHGYVGPTEEEIVDQWLNELCRNIALEAYGKPPAETEQPENK